MEYRDELSYTNEHEWANTDEGTLTVGITDFAQSELGDVVFVELPEIGTSVKLGEPFGVVESVKSVSDLYAPASGKIIEINADLESEPELVNSSPYDRGWMIKIAVSNESELSNLLSADSYKEFVESS